MRVSALLFVGLLACHRPPPPTPPAPPPTPPAPAPAPVAKPAVDERFQKVVMPILARHGCSAGTCHGTQRSGGFQIFGTPADLVAVQERIDRQHPEKSQLLVKALGQVEHNGGQNLTADACDTQRIIAWIAGKPDPACEEVVDPRVRQARFEKEAGPSLLALGCSTAACHGGSGNPATAALDLTGLLSTPPRPTATLALLERSGLNPKVPWMSPVIRAARGESKAHPKAVDLGSCAYRRLYHFVAEAPGLSCEGEEGGRPPSQKDLTSVVLPHLFRRGCGDTSCHGGGAGDMTLFNLYEQPQPAHHNYLMLLARVEDRKHPEESTLLRTPRNQEPHGGGKRLGGKSDCIDQMLVRWVQGKPVRPCPPPQPPSFASYASVMQPLMDKMTCTRADCHSAGVGDFWVMFNPKDPAVLRKNYEQVLKKIDYDFTPLSSIIVRMRESCAYAITAAWIERRTPPNCKPGKIDPALLPKLPKPAAPPPEVKG